MTRGYLRYLLVCIMFVVLRQTTGHFSYTAIHVLKCLENSIYMHPGQTPQILLSDGMRFSWKQEWRLTKEAGPFTIKLHHFLTAVNKHRIGGYYEHTG